MDHRHPCRFALIREIGGVPAIVTALLLVALPAAAQEGGRRRDRAEQPVLDFGPRTPLADAIRMPTAVVTLPSRSERTTRSDERKLQEFSERALFSPPPAARAPRADVRDLLHSIETLKRAVAASEADPTSEAGLVAVGDQRRAASLAFAAVGARLRGEGRSALAADLRDRLDSIWRDIDEAVAAGPVRRKELLGAVRVALEAAHPTGDRRHDIGVTILPTHEMP
jgi:hypothetical protein